MHDETSHAAAPGAAAPDKPAKAQQKTREQRLAEELRMNLRRRKAQARGWARQETGAGAEPAPANPETADRG